MKQKALRDLPSPVFPLNFSIFPSLPIAEICLQFSKSKKLNK